MANLTNSDILNGSTIVVFINGEAIAFATTESLSIQANTTDVSTKSHGLYPSTIVNSIGWSCTVENLASDAGIKALNALVEASKSNTPVHLKFGEPANWDADGFVGTQAAPYWTAPSTCLAEGDAIMINYSWNMPSGDNMTMSAEFKGVGALTLAQSA